MILALVLCSPAHAQRRKTFVIPFRAEHGYLLQTTVNRKPAVLILDTGSPVSFSAGRVLLLHAKNGIVSYCFDERNPLSVQYYRPERIAYDGISGNDVLEQLRSVRIDYRNSVVELEQ